MKKYKDFNNVKSMIKILDLIKKELNEKTSINLNNTAVSHLQFVSNYEVERMTNMYDHIKKYNDSNLYLYLHISRFEARDSEEKDINDIVLKYIPKNATIYRETLNDTFHLFVFNKQEFYSSNLFKSISGINSFNL